MIAFEKQNILNIEAEALVNTVNTVGVMGKGIALQFKEHFPLNFKLYQKACKNQEIKPGKMFVTETGQFTHPKYIINFPTKTDWRRPSQIEDIGAGLDDLVNIIKKKSIQSIAIPPLGCGNGGLDWKDVKPLIETKLLSLSKEIRITVIEPGFHSYTRTTKAEVPKLTKPRALVLALADAYRVLSFDISHLELQKLAYFLQEFGQNDLNLKYEKGAYGPYASNLKHLLAHLEGYYIQGQIRFQDMKPVDPLTLDEQRLKDVHAYLMQNLSAEESTRLELVEKLIRGFESPYGLELLATVHWAGKELQSNDREKVASYIHNWSARKKELMSLDQITTAFNRVNDYFPN